MYVKFFIDRFDFFQNAVFLYLLQVEKVPEKLIIPQGKEILQIHFGKFPLFLAHVIFV